MSEFCYEVCDNLPFDGGLQAVLDVELAQLWPRVLVVQGCTLLAVGACRSGRLPYGLGSTA